MNALTIDFESWVHRDFTHQCDPDKRKCMDNGYTRDSGFKILDILAEKKVRATFFVVGEIVDWYPELIDRISHDGHELGYHTYSHRQLINETVLEEELRISQHIIREYDIIGFRAPEARILRGHFAVLKKYGFTYDSSVYAPSCSTCLIDGVYEIPISTSPLWGKVSIYFPKPLRARMLLKEVPFGSGFFFALMGSRTKYFINKVNKKGVPAVILLHPWQIIPPNVTPSGHHGLKKLAMRFYAKDRGKAFSNLISEIKFLPMKEIIGSLINKS